MKITVSLVLMLIMVSACSSIKSVQSPGEGSSDGLSYYMPMKDFLVTVTVAEKESGDETTQGETYISDVSVGVTGAYPDLSKQYVLRHGGHLLGKNTLDVGVSSSGLLTSATSTTVSQVNQAFENLATSLGKVSAMAKIDTDDASPGSTCKKAQTYTFVYTTAGKYANDDAACGLTVEIVARGTDAGTRETIRAEGKQHSGIFYRQNRPYLITASGSGVRVADIVYSPTGSKLHFLPISRTFFADNKADFTFSDGVPTRYMQDTDGELIGLLKLPADIIGAYFTAVGSMFDSFGGNDKKEADALAQALKLELARQKYEACLVAIRNQDSEAIKKLGCDQ